MSSGTGWRSDTRGKDSSLSHNRWGIPPLNSWWMRLICSYMPCFRRKNPHAFCSPRTHAFQPPSFSYMSHVSHKVNSWNTKRDFAGRGQTLSGWGSKCFTQGYLKHHFWSFRQNVMYVLCNWCLQLRCYKNVKDVIVSSFFFTKDSGSI